MMRVTVRVVGGLGNQLHGYAFGRAIAAQNGAQLCVDCASGYWNDPYQREFLLDAFPFLQINKAVVPASRAGRVAYKVLAKLQSMVSRFLPIEWKMVVEEPRPYGYRPEIHQAKYRFRPTFHGYWAAYCYYEEIKAQLRHELTPPKPEHPAVVRVLDEISANESCALHWRSYVEEQHVTHPSLARYYQEAVALVRKRHPLVRFYVFSDNYAMARKTLASLGDDLVYVELPEAVGNRQSLNDFYLIYACKHKIIGDSTFSWWAAWLSDQDEKFVIAPSGLSPWGDDWTPPTWTSIPIQFQE